MWFKHFGKEFDKLFLYYVMISLDLLLYLMPDQFKDTQCSHIAGNSQYFCSACLLQTTCDFRVLSEGEDADSFDSC